MVTAAAALALSGIMAPEPLAARSRHPGHVAPVEQARPPAAMAASAVPLPQPRPAEAPPRASTELAGGKDAAKDTSKDPSKDPAKDDGKENARQEAAGPPPPSACRLALTGEIAVAPSIPAIHGPGACGGDDLVRLEAVVLPDKTRVALTPAGVMRCTMATAVVNWIRDDVAPEVAKLGSEIKTLDNFDSYECRGRNGIPGAYLSEHGKANAIDVHGFKLADGRMIELTDRTQPREFREAVLHSACTRFPTVLGPDSDGYHEDHIHVDLIERRNNYRICQWDVLDPMPKVAPLLPEERPAEAPPREVAETRSPADQAKGQADTRGGGKQADTKAGDDKPDKAVRQDLETPAGKVTTGTAPAAQQPVPPAVPAAKTPTEMVPTGESASKPATASKTVEAQPASGKPTAAKPAGQARPDQIEKRAAEKSSSQTAGSEASGADKVASEKPSRGKVAEDKPRRRRHRARAWNPFAAFF